MVKLENFRDLILKAKHDLAKYDETCGSYELFNCLMTINAIPEWVNKRNDSILTDHLKLKGKRLETLMKDHKSVPDEIAKIDFNDLWKDIDLQLEIIRWLTNYAKHAGDYKPQI